MIRNIIFDIGQVIIGWEPEKVMAQWYGAERGKMLYQATVGCDFWRDNIDVGLLTEEDIFHQLEGEHPELLEDLRDVQKRWHEIFTPIPGTQELGRRLHEAGYRLYYLSNFPEKGFLDVQAHNGIFQYMTGGLVSYQVHLCKPDPAIYQTMLQRWDLRGEESVFADDVKQNIEAAQGQGIHGHLFTTAQALEADLRDRYQLAFT